MVIITKSVAIDGEHWEKGAEYSGPNEKFLVSIGKAEWGAEPEVEQNYEDAIGTSSDHLDYPPGEDRDEVEQVRDDDDPDAMTVAELAAHYDVSESAVRRIVSDLEPAGKRGSANLFRVADFEKRYED